MTPRAAALAASRAASAAATLVSPSRSRHLTSAPAECLRAAITVDLTLHGRIMGQASSPNPM